MSHDESSEEKSLPPSVRKLRELRKKGQIARSTDMVAGVATSAALIFLWLEGRPFIQNFKLSIMSITKIDRSDFRSAAINTVGALAENLGSYIVILMTLVVSIVILTNILVNRGFLFSFNPIKFDLNKINPVDGFKRMFSLRTLIEFLKNVSKISIFLFLSVLVLATSFNAPFQVPFGDAERFRTTFFSIINPILIIAIVVFVFAGILDIGIQQWLFLRRQKMTRTEAKRDRKEEEGSPEVRAFQRRFRQQILQQPRHYTLRDATIFIEGADTIVGIRFVRGETPVPIVVCKGSGEKAMDIKDFAVENKVKTHANDEFANALFQKLEAGQSLTEEFFESFIKALVASGLL